MWHLINMYSGVPRIFLALGNFPAELFSELGSHGQFKGQLSYSFFGDLLQENSSN